MRNISFMLTEPQFIDGSKTVTRRLGWGWLTAGYQLQAVNKSQGLRPGEVQRKLGTIEVVSVRREALDAIDDADVAREGFPGQNAPWFVAMFCKHMKCEPSTPVTRIAYRKLPEGELRGRAG